MCCPWEENVDKVVGETVPVGSNGEHFSGVHSLQNRLRLTNYRLRLPYLGPTTNRFPTRLFRVYLSNTESAFFVAGINSATNGKNSS